VRRMLLVLTVALVMAAMMAVSGPAFAADPSSTGATCVPVTNIYGTFRDCFNSTVTPSGNNEGFSNSIGVFPQQPQGTSAQPVQVGDCGTDCINVVGTPSGNFLGNGHVQAS
jgi:hypothetical protein